MLLTFEESAEDLSKNVASLGFELDGPGETLTRRQRTAKYLGSVHGTTQYPFLITDRGFMVLPVTQMRLDHHAPTERVATGIDRLDEMLGGGVFRGSTIMVSGSAGTGKTTIAAHVVDAGGSTGFSAMVPPRPAVPQ